MRERRISITAAIVVPVEPLSDIINTPFLDPCSLARYCPPTHAPVDRSRPHKTLGGRSPLETVLQIIISPSLLDNLPPHPRPFPRHRTPEFGLIAAAAPHRHNCTHTTKVPPAAGSWSEATTVPSHVRARELRQKLRSDRKECRPGFLR